MSFEKPCHYSGDSLKLSIEKGKRNINLLSSLYKRGTVRGVPTGHRINYLLCAKSCAKGFRYMSFTIMNRRLSLLLTPFYRCIN